MGDVVMFRGDSKVEERLARTVDIETECLQLYESLQTFAAHASHMVSNLCEVIDNDPRLETSEWRQRFRDYNHAYLEANKLLLTTVRR